MDRSLPVRCVRKHTAGRSHQELKLKDFNFDAETRSPSVASESRCQGSRVGGNSRRAARG